MEQGLVNVTRLLSGALDLLLPHRCVACSEPLPSPSPPFCELCWQSVLLLDLACPRCGLPGAPDICPHCRRHPPPYLAARAAVEYGGQAAAAIRLLKYGGRSHLGRPLAGLLRPLLPHLQPVDRALPVPLHPARTRHRGYNQAALLARHLARGEGLTVSYGSLKRHRDTPVQASLSREHRLQNLRGAFSASTARVQGARLLLIDDVMTTGATAVACSETLLEAGAREVKVLCLARAAVLL